MPSPPSSARLVGRWLLEHAGLDEHWPSLERLIALQTDVDAYCTQMQCATAPVREATRQGLVWLARSPAQAARLRNLTSGLSEFLAVRGWQFSGVTVRLQPDKNPTRASVQKPEVRGKPALSDERLRQWETLANGLEEGPLRDAIEALVRHHESP